MALGHLLYISDAVQWISRADLESIREVSVRYNAEHDVTGVLFYSAGHFVQLLEGDPEEVRKLFRMIQRDARHRYLRLLVERPTDHRIFRDWNMGMLNLDQYSDAERRDLSELVRLAGQGETTADGTPVELEILSRFCMLLPAV